MVAVLQCQESLAVGQELVSPNGRYQLVLQGDGNLVLYLIARRSALWWTGTQGQSVQCAGMQPDGNFVLYAPGPVAKWDSKTGGKGPSFLQVQDDGNVVVYTAPPRPLEATWNSNTAHPARVVDLILPLIDARDFAGAAGIVAPLLQCQLDVARAVVEGPEPISKIAFGIHALFTSPNCREVVDRAVDAVTHHASEPHAPREVQERRQTAAEEMREMRRQMDREPCH